MNDFRRVGSHAAVVLFAAAIFVADLQTPHGVAEWVLYLPLPLLAVWFRRPWQVFGVTALCAALIVVGFFLSPAGIAYEWALGNRVMALLALGMMALASLALVRNSLHLTALTDALRLEVARRVLTEETLRRSEERLRLAMQGGGLGTRDANLETGREVWSDTQFRILGYEPTPDGAATSAMWADRVHPDDRRRIQDFKELARDGHSLYHLEYRICRPNQPKPAWVEVFGRYHYGAAGGAVRFVGVCFDISQRKDLERDLLEVTARQQQEIGQELHDGVGQELTGLGLIGQSLAERLPADTPERAVAARLVAGLERTHRAVRELARGVMPVHLDANGLSAALAELVARASEESGVEVACECPDGLALPDNRTATQMFRIAQEAVANALRHGRPRRVRVTLDADPNDLRMRIEDDGVGGAEPGGGLGLRIMTHRAALVGGRVRVGPAAGGGTAVTFTLTLPRSAQHGQVETGL